MPTDKKIKDVMIGIFEYAHIPYWFSIDQAVRIIKVSFISTKKYPEPLAILVFDEKYNLLGTLTLRDILRGLEPKFMRTPTEKAQVIEEDETAACACMGQPLCKGVQRISQEAGVRGYDTG